MKTLLAATAVLSLCIASESYASRPLVNVVVKIEDADVISNFDTIDRRHPDRPKGDALRIVTTPVAGELARRLQRAMEFITWNAAEAHDAKAQAEIQLVATPDGGATYLELRSKDGTPLPGSRRSLWAANDFVRPTDNPIDLERELKLKLANAYFDTEAALKETRAIILNAVPIAYGATTYKPPQSNRTYFVIDVPWNELKPAPGMIFKVTFERPAGDLNEMGTFYLSPSSKYKNVTIATPIHECKDHHLAFARVNVRKSLAACDPSDIAEIPALEPYLDERLSRDPNHVEKVLDRAIIQISNYDRAVLTP